MFQWKIWEIRRVLILGVQMGTSLMRRGVGRNCHNMPHQFARGGERWVWQGGVFECVCVRWERWGLSWLWGDPSGTDYPYFNLWDWGVGRKQASGCWWRRRVAVNSRLINYTSACGNILPKCQSGPCEAAHLTTLAQHVQRKTWWKTHSKKGFELH